MALPLAPLVVNAGVALGGYAVDMAPKVKNQVMAYLKTATKGAVKSLPQVVAQASNGSVPSIALLGRAMAKTGVSVDKVLDVDMIDALSKAAGAKLIDDMRADFNAVYGAVDATSTIHAPQDTARELILKKTLEWAQSQFSRNPKTLKEVHVQLKMFMEMDEATLNHLIALHM